MNTYFDDYLERLQEHFDALRAAIQGLDVEALDWIPGADMNSLAMLIAHTAGATQYWGAEVPLGIPSQRDRAAEFQTQGLTVEQLEMLLDGAEAAVRDASTQLDPAHFDQPINLAVLAVVPSAASYRTLTVGWSLLHALEHAALHTGHAQITRQLWDQRG